MVSEHRHRQVLWLLHLVQQVRRVLLVFNSEQIDLSYFLFNFGSFCLIWQLGVRFILDHQYSILFVLVILSILAFVFVRQCVHVVAVGVHIL